MQAQLFNPIEIQTMVNQNQRNRDLFEKLLDENLSPAMPSESFFQELSRTRQTEDRGQHQGCKCTKIDCLKLYCQCFAKGWTCNENCICVSCRNKLENGDQIYLAKQVANYRNPGFFENVPAFVPLRKCTCKKSQCRKRYCECFSAGLKCSQECECLGCQNGKFHQHDEQKMFSIGIQVHA